MEVYDIDTTKYRMQQVALKEIAKRLGVVYFKPAYHGARGDKNTVLLYTREDEAHNRLVDKKSVSYTRSEAADRRKYNHVEIPPEYVYRDHFWSFENSDLNGTEDMNFANFGKLDLRGPGWRDVLEGSIRLALARKRQREYAGSTGGYLELREADDTYNDMNREQISAMKLDYGSAFLGNINFYGEKRKAVADGEAGVYEEYTGQKVCNFECSFCVPKKDEALEELIRRWNSDGNPANVEQILNRVEAIGGINFIWY